MLIAIFGESCSGKSTLARALGAKLGLPVIHLDQLWWKEGWVESDRQTFDDRLAALVEENRWIIDGNYNRTMPERLQYCDTVIYLDFSRWLCLWGFFHRLLTRKGTARPDLPEGCPEKLEWDFLKYIWNFNKNNRVLNYTRIAKSKHATAYVLKNRKKKKFLWLGRLLQSNR